MINRTVLTGRLTRNPELRYTNSGTAVAMFNLAVARQFRNQQGERETDFISCVIWRKSAENFCNFTHKGSLVGVEGRLQTRSYQDKQGQTVYVTEVVVDDFALLEPRQSGQQGNYQNPQQAPQGGQNVQQGNYQQQPQNAPQGYQGQNNGYAQGNGPAQVNDDNLPF